MDLAIFFSRLTERGYQRGQNQFEKRRIVFLNIVISFMVLSTLIMVFVAKHPSSKILNVSGLLVFSILYYLHGFKPKLTVLLVGFVYQIFIFIHSSILDVGGQVEFGALAMTAILPIFFRRWWSVYFLISNAIVFYYPYLVLNAYQSFFKLAYIFGVALYFIIDAFVDESEKYEKALIEKQKDLEGLNKEKNNLIQVVAHDLKSPLNQIAGWISLLQMSEQISKTADNYISKIVNSVDHMSNMISRILDIEKIEKRLTIELTPVQVIPIVKKVVDKFKILAANKEIRIEEQFPDNTLWVDGEANYMEQIFDNLLSNAIKFSAKRKVVTVIVEEDDEQVKIKFVDHGPGISASDQEKLYIRFEKLTARPTDNEDSTGLGLAITKSFVTAMNGKITCDSQLGEGATFTVSFSKATVGSG